MSIRSERGAEVPLATVDSPILLAEEVKLLPVGNG